MTAIPDWGIPGWTDAELALAAAAGDRGAFAGIYDRFADRLHDFCVGMVRDRDAAADCVQDVFCTAATTLNQLREPDKLRPWLYAIARNEALRRIRARRREQPTDELPDAASADAGPDTLAARSELANLIAEAAGGLSNRDRAVLELGYRHGLEGPDLAEALGVSPATANKMVHRLRDTMERSLGALLVARRGRTAGNQGDQHVWKWVWTQISFSVKMTSMPRKKTTVYIDEALLRAAKVAAARSGKREYEVFEDALRRHLGFAGTVERIWAGITPAQAPSEEDAARLAAEELAAVRAERSPRWAG